MGNSAGASADTLESLPQYTLSGNLAAAAAGTG